MGKTRIALELIARELPSLRKTGQVAVLLAPSVPLVRQVWQGVVQGGATIKYSSQGQLTYAAHPHITHTRLRVQHEEHHEGRDLPEPYQASPLATHGFPPSPTSAARRSSLKPFSIPSASPPLLPLLPAQP